MVTAALEAASEPPFACSARPHPSTNGPWWTWFGSPSSQLRPFELGARRHLAGGRRAASFSRL